MVTVEITYAAPHHLVADGPIRVRPPHARRRRLGASYVRSARRRPRVGLGMPSVGVPAPLPPAAPPAAEPRCAC